MIKNRSVSVLSLAVFSFCMVYAQTSGRWIKYYEDEDGVYSYRSDLKTDMDNNHYVWVKCNITSPKERMRIANGINSSTPVHNILCQIEFDSGYELAKPLHFSALSNSGKVLLEAKSETLGKWKEVNNHKDQFLYALSKQLGGKSISSYEKTSRHSDKVYSKLKRGTYSDNKETNRQYRKVYEDLLEIIKEKQRKQNETTQRQVQLEDDDSFIVGDPSQIETEKEEKHVQLKVVETKIFDVVEEMPQFPGGPSALFEYLSKSIKYPTIAEENGVQGRVIVTFIVERDGSITNVRVVKSVEPSLDQEAIRVVKSMPHWIPGKQNGKPFRVKYTVPVTFKLQ